MADTRDPRIEAVARELREFFGDGIANLTNRVPALASRLIEAADRAAAPQTDTDAVGRRLYWHTDPGWPCPTCGHVAVQAATPDSSVSPTHGESES